MRSSSRSQPLCLFSPTSDTPKRPEKEGNVCVAAGVVVSVNAVVAIADVFVPVKAVVFVVVAGKQAALRQNDTCTTRDTPEANR